jgi:hypothetical protein
MRHPDAHQAGGIDPLRRIGTPSSLITYRRFVDTLLDLAISAKIASMHQFRAVAIALLVSITAVFVSTMAVVAASTSPIQLPASGTYLFGDLSFSSNGNLYVVDMQHSQIDEVTNSALKDVISMPKVKTSSNVIEGIQGLSISGNTIWFSANGSLYKASLDGRDIERVASVLGASDVDAFPDGTVLYAVNSQGSANGAYEHFDNGTTRRVAGGGKGSYCAFATYTGQIATSISAEPTSLIGLGPATFYYDDANELCLVTNGRVYALGHDFHNGELAVGPHGTVYSICDWAMCRVTAQSYRQLFKLQTRVNGDFASPAGMAVSPSGVIYESYNDQGGGRAGIMRLSPTGTPTVVIDAMHS